MVLTTDFTDGHGWMGEAGARRGILTTDFTDGHGWMGEVEARCGILICDGMACPGNAGNTRSASAFSSVSLRFGKIIRGIREIRGQISCRIKRYQAHERACSDTVVAGFLGT